jgi:hypothetical protein
MKLIRGKTRGKKSRATVPLGFLFMQFNWKLFLMKLPVTLIDLRFREL